MYYVAHAYVDIVKTRLYTLAVTKQTSLFTYKPQKMDPNLDGILYL